MIFLDTNIILRFILNDHPLYSQKAITIINKIDTGKIKVYLSWLVIFEIVFVLQNTHKLPKVVISEKLLSLLILKNIVFERKSLLEPTFKYYAEKNISFADAYHIALITKKRIHKIYSFDRDFDKLPAIQRLEE